jgi:hypothetical protein
VHAEAGPGGPWPAQAHTRFTQAQIREKAPA